MKKFICVLFVIVLTFSLFAGCAKKEPAPAPAPSEPEELQVQEEVIDISGKKIAICMGSINHPVHRIVQYGFVTKAEELGLTPIISGLDDGSIQDHINTWNSDIINNGVEGAVIWTGDDSCFEMMKELKTMGVSCVVPHFLHSFEETKDFIDRNIAASQATYCADVAKFLVDTLAEKGITSGVIVHMIHGSSVTPPAVELFKAAMINLNTDFTVIEVIEGYDIETAVGKCVDTIKNIPDVVAVFGSTGASPQAWNKAMELTGKTDLVVVGMDYTALNIDTVKNGHITGLVCQPLFTEGQESADSLAKILGGQIFNDTYENWYKEMEAPIAVLGGEGENGIEHYQNILDLSEAYFKE